MTTSPWSPSRHQGCSFSPVGKFRAARKGWRAEEDHSADEDRFVLLGLSARLQTRVVCHCYRQGDEVIPLNYAKSRNLDPRTAEVGLVVPLATAQQEEADRD